MPPPLHEQFYATLRHALVTGAVQPGREMSLRGLAHDYRVGVMPVREAVRRLAAEGALAITGTRRIVVPVMDASLFEELMRARMLLEPECARRALPAITATLLHTIRGHDAALDRSFRGGDAQAYMTANHAFHFAIYRAAPSAVLTPVVESLWLRIGPFMRVVYSQLGTARLVDHHARAIDAIARRDAAALGEAIEADIIDGMRLLGLATFLAPSSPGRLTKHPPLAERDHAPVPPPSNGVVRKTHRSSARP